MMQNPALQDKLCLKFLLVVVSEVFAHMLRDRSRSKQSGQYYRDTCVTKSTLLWKQWMKFSRTPVRMQIHPTSRWSNRTLTLSPASLSCPGQSTSAGYQIQAPTPGCHTSRPACLLSVPSCSSVSQACAQISNEGSARCAEPAWTHDSLYL